MKLYLNSNIAEGTPEELVTYKELLKERGLDSEKSLFHFGHMHQPTEEEVQDTFKGFFGSLKIEESSVGATESSTEEAEENVEEDSMHDVGALYTVTEEASASPLPVGAILQHLHGRIFIDSKGQQCIISRPSFVEREHVNGDAIKQDRFELAKQLGIQLTSTTDLAQATEGKYFKVKEEYSYFDVGDLVTIDEDDKDNQPLCKDEHGNSIYMYLHHLELVEDSLESTESSTDEAQTPSRDLQVGDRVKVLNSLGGAVGEATVSAVLEGGRVELAGNNKEGNYLSDWNNYISNVEKIEKPASFGALQAKAYLEDKSVDQVVEEEQRKYKQASRDTEADTKSNGIRNYTVDSEPTAVQYYKVEDDSYLHPTVKQGTVVKKTGEDKTSVVFETSTGLSQIIPRRHLKLLDTTVTEDRFKFAEEAGVVLTVDTDFAEECKGHHFKVTKDESLSNFTPTDILTVRRDDSTDAIAFKSFSDDVQYTLLKYVKEVARPSK